MVIRKQLVFFWLDKQLFCWTRCPWKKTRRTMVVHVVKVMRAVSRRCYTVIIPETDGMSGANSGLSGGPGVPSKERRGPGDAT